MTADSRLPIPHSPPVFSWPTRVYWEDTDAGGVVYHARYVAFLERARTEWMRAVGYGQEAMRQQHGLVFAVRSMQLDFLKPARLDDALSVSAVVLKCKRASLLFAQSVRREGEVLLTAQVRIAALGASDFRPCGMDDAVYDVLKALETPESDY